MWVNMMIACNTCWSLEKNRMRGLVEKSEMQIKELQRMTNGGPLPRFVVNEITVLLGCTSYLRIYSRLMYGTKSVESVVKF